MYSVTGNRSFKGHSGQLFLSNRIPIEYLAFTPLKEAEIGYLRLVLGFVCFKKPMFTFVREGSGSLTTQLKTDEKVDRARSGAQGIFNLDQQLTFSRTILLQAFPQHIGMSRTCIQFQDCIEIVFDTATRLWFHKDPRNLAH